MLSTLTVTKSTDSGPGSLRAVIAGASSGDTIVFSQKLNGRTILLTSGELVVDRSLNIMGSAAQKLGISGGGKSRVFDVSGGAALSLSNLTITGGAAEQGAGIYNEAGSSLAIIQSTLSGNEASGGMTGNAQGGAIFNAAGARLSIQGSLLTGNQTDGTDQSFGGAVYNQGSVSIVGSTFKNNTQGAA